MPLLTLHLLKLGHFTSVAVFLEELQAEDSVEVVLASRPRNKIIKPSELDVEGLGVRYELVLLLRGPEGGIPSRLRSHIYFEYKIAVGVPSQILKSYPERNTRLLNTAPHAKLSGALSARGKDVLPPDLYKFQESLTKSYGNKPVTMLNLLRFQGTDGKAKYKQYGEAFVPIAAQRGAEAKIVGNVVHTPSNGPASALDSPPGSTEGEWWDEVSLVHYPSIKAFCDVLASEEYQEINTKYRLGALKDTLLICTTEISLDVERTKTKL